MKSLSEVKNQITQTEDLSTIITTMKNISVVNTTHYERRLQAVRQYSQTVEEGFHIFLKSCSADFIDQLKKKNQNTPPTLLAIVIGSEKGLCGEFNERIARFLSEQTAEKNLLGIVPIGYKITGKISDKLWKMRDYPVSHEEILHLIQDLMTVIQELLNEKKLGEVRFFHNQLLSGTRYTPKNPMIFPLNTQWLDSLKDKPWPSRCLPTMALDESTLFYELTQELLFISMYRAFIESLAAENASRLASMQTAEENIQEQLVELQARYNSQRQTQITEELADITSGFEALEK